MEADKIIIQNVLFVNSAVSSLSPYTNKNTLEIGYATDTSTTNEIMHCVLTNHTNINRIGFAFHYSGEDFIPFLNQEPFFTDADLGDSVETYSRNVQFMLDLILLLLGGGITHVDFLACNTLENEKWKLFYQLLQSKTGVLIGASDNNTGNLKYGGDWVMESTQEEVGQIYFTSEIVNWASLLTRPTGLNTYYHTFYTVNASDATVMTRTIYNNAGTTILDTIDISFGGMLIKDVFSMMDGGGTNPYTIGIVDGYLNKICMDIAYCDVYTKSLTSIQKLILMTYVNATYKEPHTAATIYTVTVNGGVYWISTNGGTPMLKPTLLISIGSVYMFDLSSSSETVTFSSTFSRSLPYTTGVVSYGIPGNLNAYSIIDVSSNTPTSLYYGSAIMGGNIVILTSPVMLTTSASTVETGGSVIITCLTNLPLPLSYTITGVNSTDLSESLTGNFLSSSESLTLHVVSGVGSTMVFTVSGGYTTTISISKPLTTTLYNPPETYRLGDSYGYGGINSQLNDLTGFCAVGGNMSIFMWFPTPSEYVTGFYIQKRKSPDDGQYWNSCYFDYTYTDTVAVTSSNVKNLTYTRLNYTDLDQKFTQNYTGTYSNPSSNYTLSEHTFTTPIRASAVKFTQITSNQYPGVRLALKYMGTGLITQLIATSTVTMTIGTTLKDDTCNNVYTFSGSGYSSTTDISGEINNVGTRGYISAGNGCLRSNNVRWMPHNLFSESPKLTIMCWVYLTGYQQYDTIAGFDNGIATSGLSFGFQNGILKLAKDISRFTETQLSDITQLSLSNWTHICATMHLDANGYGVITYYINGVSIGTFTDTVSWNGTDTIPTNSTFYVGKYSYAGTNNNTTSRALNRVNYLRLFNNKLSSSDVLAYYNTST